MHPKLNRSKNGYTKLTDLPDDHRQAWIIASLAITAPNVLSTQQILYMCIAITSRQTPTAAH